MTTNNSAFKKMHKRGLCIGLNYTSLPKLTLQGCINDANNIATLLKQQLHFDYVEVLTDATVKANHQPWGTRSDILSALREFFCSLAPNDVGVVSFSGHGTQAPDKTHTEADGLDEALYSIDEKLVLDNDLRLLVNLCPSTCKVFALFDSCHSGTVLDLRYKLADGAVVSTALSVDANFKATSSSVVCLSGCMDSQTSLDVVVANKNTGALTWAFLSAMAQSPQNYLQLFQIICRLVKDSGFAQKPQLTSGRLGDISEATFWH